ncbi:pentatricopeptide repeat-containing protein 1, mitochondrial [Adelges cooleyi]|uniref:pentatricopeptide repeat-containing protein 1, mitochondrial n=1 Tax=Adelges cooleyi TaxID=133065 RepID=UPI0021805029|nr:pentatricopeptide repeat-containing protein 1, mitochondrial [Adelges cooleyi]XP_050440369.1 pentatricopeptide repeat-containing protein 1, mitochondrial [Adelges cooleyi]
MYAFDRTIRKLLNIKSFQKNCTHLYNKNEKYMSTSRILQTKNFREKTESISFTALRESGTDSDIFGSLSNKVEVNEKLDELPSEPDDKIEYDKDDEKKRLYITEYHKIIQELISQHKIAEAIDVLETRMLKDEKAKPDYYVYNLLIGSCGKVGYVQKAFSLFNQMKKIGIKTTSATYTCLFNACANSPYKNDALKRAKKLHNLMTLKCIEPNIFNYHAMIKAFGRTGDLLTAFSLVDEMVTKKYKLKDETFNFLLQACISDKKAGFRHALLVWRKMVSKKVRPSLYTYNLLLKCTRECELGDEFETRKLIGEIVNDPHLLTLQAQLQEPSEVKEDNASTVKNLICNDKNSLTRMENRPNLLDVCPYFGNIVSISEIKNSADRLMLLGGCSGFLSNMKLNKVKPDIKIFTQLLESIPSTLSAEQNLLNELSKSKVRFDIDFCNILIKKRSMRCDYEEAKNVLSLINSEDLSVDIVTFGVLALGCKNKAEAKDLIKSMTDHGFRVNSEILGTMLGQGCFHFNFGYVIFMLNMIKHEEIKPNKMFMERLNSFEDNIRDLMRKRKNKDPDAPNFIHSYYFKEGCRKFQNFYHKWLSDITVEENLHPWDQFRKQRKENC